MTAAQLLITFCCLQGSEAPRGDGDRWGRAGPAPAAAAPAAAADKGADRAEERPSGGAWRPTRRGTGDAPGELQCTGMSSVSMLFDFCCAYPYCH